MDIIAFYIAVTRTREVIKWMLL